MWDKVHSRAVEAGLDYGHAGFKLGPVRYMIAMIMRPMHMRELSLSS